MAETMLNKFEKQERVIQLHKEGKTIREISKEARMAFRDISKIIKAHEKKSRLENIIENSDINKNHHIKKLSTGNRAFKLFLKNKKPVEVAIELNISYQEVYKYWLQFLKLQNKYEVYEFYEDFRYEMPQLLSISGFLRRNKIDTANISYILRYAKCVSDLQSCSYKLQNEIAELKREKKLYIAPQNSMYYQVVPPIRPMPSKRYNRILL